MGCLAPRDFKSLASTYFATRAIQNQFGGWTRNRTGVRGFAGRCITTLPSSQSGFCFEAEYFTWLRSEIQLNKTLFPVYTTKITTEVKRVLSLQHPINASHCWEPCLRATRFAIICFCCVRSFISPL